MYYTSVEKFKSDRKVETLGLWMDFLEMAKSGGGTIIDADDVRFEERGLNDAFR